MAKQLVTDQELKRQLIADLDTQRKLISERAGQVDLTARESVRRATDIPTLLKASFTRHPLAWAAGGAVAAFAATRLLLSPRKSPDKKSPSKARASALSISAVAGFIGKSAFKALRPVIEKAIRERISGALNPPPATTSLKS